MWCLALILFYLLNDKTAKSQVSPKINELKKNQESIFGMAEGWTNNEVIKFLNTEVIRLNKLVTSNATTPAEKAIKSEIVKISKLELVNNNKIENDYDNEESFEDDDIPHYKPMASKERKHTIPKKDIIKANGTRDIYVINVNNDNGTIIYVYDEGKNNNITHNDKMPRTDITQIKLHNFFHNMYDFSVNNFYLLRNQAKDRVFEAYLDSAIDYFTTEYNHEVKSLEFAENNVDKVKITLECIKLVQNLVDNLIIVINQKYSDEKMALSLKSAIHESFEKLIDKEIIFICRVFGICISSDTFKGVYITIIDTILQGNDDTMFSAMYSLVYAFGKNNEHFKKTYLEKMVKSEAKEQARSESKEFWIDLRKSIKESNHFDKIPVNAENVALWRKVLSEVESFVKGEIKDLTATFTAFRNFMIPYYISGSL